MKTVHRVHVDCTPQAVESAYEIMNNITTELLYVYESSMEMLNICINEECRLLGCGTV
jgi:hypothetical protein